MSGQSTLRIQNVTKSYRSGETTVDAVKEISLDIAEGETVAIFGPSGSGKTTLLGLCAGLDRPSSGDISIEGESLNSMDEIGLSRLRNEKIGFIFQSFRLIPSLTALENVMIPAEIRGDRGVEERAVDLLRRVGLENRLHNYPSQLSGGEQQRVALARALVMRPEILVADEPTGNLDSTTGVAITKLLFDLHKSRGATLVLVTHDEELAEKCDRVVRMRSGRIAADGRREEVEAGAGAGQ